MNKKSNTPTEVKKALEKQKRYSMNSIQFIKTHVKEHVLELKKRLLKRK
jgi:hypothetical protein